MSILSIIVDIGSKLIPANDNYSKTEGFEEDTSGQFSCNLYIPEFSNSNHSKPTVRQCNISQKWKLDDNGNRMISQYRQGRFNVINNELEISCLARTNIESRTNLSCEINANNSGMQSNNKLVNFPIYRE